MNPNPQFPNAPGGGGMPGVKPGMQPPNKEHQNIIMGHVAQALQNQGPFSGWKAEVHLKVRAMNVWQMITSLRLIQPRIDIQNAANAALSFEQKAFKTANERSDYDRECNEKLNHIKDTRQRQAAVAMNFNPQAGMMPNQMQNGFPQQMNRGMQSSMPGQHQMAMGMNDPNQQVAMQQRQQQQSALLQQQQQQRAQQRPGNGGTIPDDLNNLSPQENEHVTRLASQMLAKTSPEDMEKIKMNLSNMSPEQRQYLARKDMDPMTYFFRSQALNQLRRHRRARMDSMRGNNPGMDPNGGMMGDPMMNQRQLFQNMMTLQRNSGFSGSPGQSLDSNSFIGNVENIQGQQADGLRSQEAGQLVVPASSSQMNQAPFPNQQNMFPQQMGQNGQSMNNGGMNPQIFGQQNFQNGSNGPQDRMQFSAQQSQAQAQAQAQARAQAAAAQKAQIALSGHGGQGNVQPQGHMAQSSPVMPMLNQPMAPGQMSPVQVPGQARPASRPPNMGQHPTGVQGQPSMQGRPAIPPGLPQAVQEQLAQMTNEQLQAFFMNQRRAAMANNMARNNQQPGGMQQPGSRPGQGQAIFNGQMANNPAMRNAMNLPQGMNPTGSAQPQQLQGQQLTPQQRAQQQQRQQELYKAQLLRAQNSGVEMTPEQIKEMDRAAFPPSLLNQNNNPAQVPKQIKTWGQLKQWVAANPQASIGVDPSKLMVLQRLHFGHIVSARNGGDPNSQGQGMMPQPPQGPQGPMGIGPNFVNGQLQGQDDMPMRPITASDVQMARQKLGQSSANFSDDHIRGILQQRQKQIFVQAARHRQMNNTGTVSQPGQLNHPMSQPPVPMPQPAAQPKAPAVQPPTATAESQTNTKAPAAGKNAKAATGKQGTKNSKVKVENNEETRASATPQQPQPAATPAAVAPPRQIPQLSQEQLASMTPPQRAQYEAQLRRQQQQNGMRVPPVNRATAEENWNKNLPPHIMEVANDIAANAPPIKPLPLSAEQKAAMSQQIMENLDMISRMDAVVVRGFANSPGHEKHIRHLLAMRFQLMRQFKDSPEWVLNDSFTIQPEWLQGTIMFIRKVFHMLIMSANKSRPNPNQAAAAAAQQNPANPNALNSSNLQQLQQQEEALQNARRASTQSGSVAAPPPFGAPSPSGVPHAYGPGGLAPEKLKLPPPKKRKQSQAGPVSASPVQSSAAPVPTAGYQRAMADAKNSAAALAGAFKCSVDECQYHFQGFPTQAALDKHVEENHQPEEEEIIENPLQYYLDSVSIGLGLTTDGQQPKQPNESVPVTNAGTKLSAMTSPAKQGMPTPVTSGNTPMARVASQLDAKAMSPATPQHLTPQQVTNRNPKLSPGKQPGKRTLDEFEGKDPWAEVPMNLEKIHDTFAPIFAECQRQGLGFSHGYDAFDEFMNTDMWQEQTDNTPDSRDIALATLTPTDDAPKTNSKNAAWNDWMPWDEDSTKEAADWMGIPCDPSDELISTILNPNGTETTRLDWANLDQQQKEMNLENGGIAIAAL